MTAHDPSSIPQPDWGAALGETLANLRAMLRLNTVNPPGNEIQVARLLEGVFAAEGIETHLFEPSPGRAALVARLRGDGSKQPVALIAHMDVVGVEAGQWTTDPFGAEVRNGYVYGRGAIDDKGMLATNLQTMLLLKRANIALTRDVIFVANSDEETGGTETERAAMADIVSGDAVREARGARVLEGVPVLDAVLRNGISTTLLHGGIRTNVIPTEATVRLNVRTLPGESIDAVVERLRGVIADPQVTVTIESRGADAPVSDFTSPMFQAMKESALALLPSLTVVPYLSTGATDSARLRQWGVQAFGLLPFPMDQDDEERMHGNDERIPIASLEFGMTRTYGAIARVAS